MSATNSSHASASAMEAPTDSRGEVTKRRNRSQLSCSACRHRNYPAPTRRNKPERAFKPGNASKMQTRIETLERLVVSLMNNGETDSSIAVESPGQGSITRTDDEATSEGPPILEDEEWERVTRSLGRISVEKSQTSYVGAGHWAAILDGIAEVKDYLEEKEDSLDDHSAAVETSRSSGPSFIFGATRPLSKDELLASVPPKAVVDRLVSCYFNSNDAVSQIMHAPTFQERYEQFWEGPAQTSTTWLAQLFAIMCLATYVYKRTGERPPEAQGEVINTTTIFRERTAQCLMLADYTKPTAHTVEAIFLYLGCEFFRSGDAQVSVSVLASMLIRMAMHMGYHRDSDPYPNISAFDGEMRRRVWAILTQMEVLLAFQNGLPSMVPQDQCDTKLPRNLMDGDFDETTVSLPSSRPITDNTPVSYTICKGTIIPVFGVIVVQATAFVLPPYEQVMALDGKLQDAHEKTPPHLRIRSMDRSIIDPPHMIMQRLRIDLLYQKARCVLHRKYLAKAHSSDRYMYSRRSCLEAATRILQHQSTMDHEIQPGGQLHRDRWFVSSLTTHDFLLAAMITCLELYYINLASSSRPSSATGSDWAGANQRDLLQALETSYEIWNASKQYSAEAYKASEALAVMLGKVHTNRATAERDKANQKRPGQPLNGSAASAGREAMNYAPPMAHSTTSTRDSLSTPDTGTSNSLGTDPIPLIASSDNFGSPSNMGMRSVAPLANMEEMLDAPGELDWDLWDTYFKAPGNLFGNETDEATAANEMPAFFETDMTDVS